MISKVKEQTKENIAHIVVAVVTAAALGAFCRAVQYPLIIPLFLLFLALHLILCRKVSYKLFLHLGLLLALIVFAAHAVIYYTQIPVRYIPVAGVALLTMLLFNDLQLAFMMSLAGSLLVSLIVGGDFGMMLTFFMGSLAGAYMV
ncbi:MAG: hypothetical protein HZA29_01745 [Candidatus Omnitrophica bacterium]|nr:hypothetical protein [Candidatus Omnitrophota bacterium]